MKLISKTSFYYIGFSIVGFILGGFIFYHIISSIINSRTNEDLKTEKKLIEEQIIQSDSIPDFTPYFGHQILVTLYDHVLKPSTALRDTIITDTITSEDIPYRYVISLNNKGNKSYSIEIFKPLINSNQLIEDIFFGMAVMFIFLLISLILTNYLISRKTWSAFYSTLKKIREYNIQTEKGLKLSPTKISEFKQLNEVLVQMTDKIYNNYINLKEFTENASHEIQTPLAIIKSKLELLIQGHPLNDEQMEIVQSVYKAVTRLSKLNSNLILLSKIENDQFHDSVFINLNLLIESTLENLGDLILQKELFVQKNLPDTPVEIKINPSLAEILFVNLISNAVKHNIRKGIINVFLDHKKFVISNSGSDLNINPEMMFNRFKKGNRSSESLGLGLSIVQKIANLYQMQVLYINESGLHTLSLKFENLFNNGK